MSAFDSNATAQGFKEAARNDRATAVPQAENKAELNSFRQSEQPSINPVEDPNMELNINFDGPEFDKKGKESKQKGADNVAQPALRKQKTASGFNRGEPPGGSSSLPDENEESRAEVLGN